MSRRDLIFPTMGKIEIVWKMYVWYVCGLALRRQLGLVSEAQPQAQLNQFTHMFVQKCYDSARQQNEQSRMI